MCWGLGGWKLGKGKEQKDGKQPDVRRLTQNQGENGEEGNLREAQGSVQAEDGSEASIG